MTVSQWNGGVSGFVSMSGQSVRDICGNNFISGIIPTAGISLRAIEYIGTLSTVLTDSFSAAGILWCGGIRDYTVVLCLDLSSRSARFS